jgi:hypothetical protein
VSGATRRAAGFVLASLTVLFALLTPASGGSRAPRPPVLIDVGCDTDSLDVTLVDPRGRRDPAPPHTPLIRGRDRAFGHRFRDQFPKPGPMEAATSIELTAGPEGDYTLIVAARATRACTSPSCESARRRIVPPTTPHSSRREPPGSGG